MTGLCASKEARRPCVFDRESNRRQGDDKHEVGTHRGAVGKFSLFYVKTGVFSKEDGRLYSHLQKLREDGEYNCFIDIEREEVEQKIEPSKVLMAKIKDYIQTHP